MSGAARLDVMNFLNEAAGNYPSAISFASGRPSERFFRLAEWMDALPDFLGHFGARLSVDVGKAANLLAQYGATNGIVNDLIARQLANDEKISCDPGQIVVTTGCQEAIALCLRTFCRHEDDIILVRSPSYIGITGAALTNGVAELPFACPDVADMAAALRHAIAEAETRGKHPRLLYLVPDFDNPTATVLPRHVRSEIIGLCAEKRIVVLEDNPYGMFRFAGERVPTMYELDTRGCVVYLGTYSKTLCPALRVGFAVVPPALFGDAAQSHAAIARLSQEKSFGTVNTSQISQAIVGGVLIAKDCSLLQHIAPAIALYRDNHAEMQRCLESTFADRRDCIAWNEPEGGFFLIVNLPFRFAKEEAEICARDYGVIVMPLSFFAYDDGCDCQVRLAFSNVARDDIAKGVARFAKFVEDRLRGETALHAA